jgi:hypothetical protein
MEQKSCKTYSCIVEHNTKQKQTSITLVGAYSFVIIKESDDRYIDVHEWMYL